MRASLLDSLPLWGLFIATLLLVLFSIEGGYRLGRYRHRFAKEEKAAPVGSIVGAVLGLLAFLLAFTFGLAATRFDARRQMVLDEANTVGTTYLRAGLLPERGEEIRWLLREYVDVRLEAARTNQLEPAKVRSEELLDKLWMHATSVGVKHPDSIVVGLFIQSLNETIDTHSKRLVAVQNRIPPAIWFSLYTISILALATMGYHSALAETSRSMAILAVAISFSVAIWLIADLDRPQEGSLRISQQVMVDLRESMEDAKPPMQSN